jgi:hypothetical protein
MYQDSLGILKCLLVRGEITYAAAKEQDSNILHQLGYREQKIRYFTYLYRDRKLIETIVAHHLGLISADACHIVDVEDWIHGSFMFASKLMMMAKDRTLGRN